MTIPLAPAGCRLLEWDTAFFGRRIARLDAPALASGAAAAAEAWLESERIECAYLLVDATDQAASDAAVASGFRLVDRRVTLEASGPVLSRPTRETPGIVVRAAADSDIAALCALARAGHHDTRFYADGRFERERCDALYEEWIRQSCRGWADRVIIADREARPVGYVTCHRRPDRGEIGLAGVDAGSRGMGVATAMLHEALAWFGAEGCHRVSVATQSRNTAGLRLYEAAGFTVASIALWYHRWIDRPLTR